MCVCVCVFILYILNHNNARYIQFLSLRIRRQGRSLLPQKRVGSHFAELFAMSGKWRESNRLGTQIFGIQVQQGNGGEFMMRTEERSFSQLCYQMATRSQNSLLYKYPPTQVKIKLVPSDLPLGTCLSLHAKRACSQGKNEYDNSTYFINAPYGEQYVKNYR